MQYLETVFEMSTSSYFDTSISTLVINGKSFLLKIQFSQSNLILCWNVWNKKYHEKLKGENRVDSHGVQYLFLRGIL